MEKKRELKEVESLKSGALKMKVSERNCRARVLELLKMHRQNERRSSAA